MNNTVNKITEGNAFAINIRQAVWRTLGGVIQPLLASELVDVHLYVGSGTSRSIATEYNVTADGDTISAVMPATLKRGVYKTWLTAKYKGREVASNCDAAFEVVPFDEHYQAYAPERVDAPMAVYLQPADVTDAELEQLKAEFRAKNAALDAAKAEAEQARQEYIAKADALESVATSEQVVALGALTSEEIGRVKKLIGTPEEGQAETLFAAINASPVGIIADVEQGKKAISDAILYRGGESSPTDAFSAIAESVRNIPLDEIVLGGTEWVDGFAPKTADDVLANMKDKLLSINNDTIEEAGMFIRFNNFSALQSVSMGKLKVISLEGLFKDCKSLKSVSLPSLTNISTDTFNGCTFQVVSLPSLTNISGNNTFSNCLSLQVVSLPLLTSIGGSSTFYNCESLQVVSLPLLTSIGSYNTFYNCLSLQVVSLPLLTSIGGSSTFYNCKSLVRVETSLSKTDGQFDGNSVRLNYISIANGAANNINLKEVGSKSEWDVNVDAYEWNANFRDGIIDRVADLSDLPTPQTITLGQYAFAKLTEETIAMATAKGWNIAQA